MIDERREELAALYALDLLDGAEHAAFAREVEGNPAVRSLVDELRESSAALACAAPMTPVPANLKARVLASAVTTTHQDSARNVLSFPRLLPWAAAAGFALVAGWFAQLYLSARSAAQLASTQQALADVALQQAQQQIEAERILSRRQLASLDSQLADARVKIANLDDRLQREADLAHLKITALASMLKNSPEAIAVAVWNPDRQEGVLKVDKLPALAADKEYQLWVVDPQYPNPVDGGVFTVDPLTGTQKVAFKAKQPVKVVNAFAVTLERKGGVPVAEGPFVLLGK